MPNIFLVDILTYQVHFSKKIKDFRMFSACGRGSNDRIYMIGGVIPNKEQEWTSDATFIPSITEAMKKKGIAPLVLSKF